MTPRYRAFISYDHSDKRVAAWLHHALESYRIPAKLVGKETRVGPVPRHLTPIFRDRDELAASNDLGDELTAAIKASMALIVICSPDAAVSHWVGQEILAFKRTHGEGRVFAVIVAGEPYASARTETAGSESFPRELRFRIGDDGGLSNRPAEPIAADLRPGGDGKRLAKLKLVAGLTGLKLDDLAQREAQRRIRRLTVLASAALVGMFLAGALALYANARRIEANEQRQIAERESATARAASDYLVDTFALSNPATENPRTVTALSILRRGAARAHFELDDQPVIEARLIATLGKAYNNLGLFAEAGAAIEKSHPAIRVAGADGVDALLTLAETYSGQGRFDRALSTVAEAREVLSASDAPSPELVATASLVEGRVLISTADTARGLSAFDRAIALYRSSPTTKSHRLATVLMNRGLALSDDQQFNAAEASLSEALSIYRRELGDQHLHVGQSWFALAQNAFLAGNLPLAETRIARALAVERRMLDADNPIIADALSMQGQIYQGQGKLGPAQAALEEAVAVYRKAFGGPHYLIGIAEVYLALIASDRGETARALAILDDAKRNYDASYGGMHANHGDLLVNRATILAKAGRAGEARADCAAGLAILGKTLGPTANYTKAMAETCAAL